MSHQEQEAAMNCQEQEAAMSCQAQGESMDYQEKSNQEQGRAACPYCMNRTKSRTEKEYKDLMNRLSRIEGQIRGIKGMMEKDAYCTDIITQVSAVTAALNSFNKVLLSQHIKTCVIEDIKQGKEETIDDLLTTLQKLMK